jgi:sec-independent protein translocase protein TatB
MLSFGLSEIALTIIVIVIVVGPKEIPNLLRQLGSFSKALRKASRQFKNSLNELAEEGDLKDLKNSISDISDIKNSLNPSKELKNEINSIKDSVSFVDDEIKNIDSKISKK